MPKHIAWDYTVDNYHIYPISDEADEVTSGIEIYASQSQKNNDAVQSISVMLEEICESVPV